MGNVWLNSNSFIYRLPFLPKGHRINQFSSRRTGHFPPGQSTVFFQGALCSGPPPLQKLPVRKLPELRGVHARSPRFLEHARAPGSRSGWSGSRLWGKIGLNICKLAKNHSFACLNRGRPHHSHLGFGRCCHPEKPL